MLNTTLDTNRYLTDNPDVAAAGHDAQRHYQHFGRFEGRPAYSIDGFALHQVAEHITQLAKLLNTGFASLAVPELHYWLQQDDAVTQWFAGSILCQWYFRQGHLYQAWQVFKQLPDAACAQQRYQHFSQRFAAEFPEHACSQQPSLNSSAPNANQYAWIVQANLAAKQGNALAWLDAINQPYQRAGLSGLAWTEPPASINLAHLSPAKTALAAATGPLVSIIVPMYNAASSIGMVLSSLLQQRWQNIEILVVDDASTDHSAAIVAEYAAKDPRVRCIASENNAGAYHARNLGLEQARGEFITVNDSDDWAHPDKILLQLQALLSSPSHQASISYWVRMQPQGHLLGCWQLEGPFIEKNHSSALFRRQLFTQLGYWDEVRIAADTEFLRRLTAVFGEQTIVEVQPELPLSLSLSRIDALTKQQATHVSTIDFGVRWAYRQLSGYWLKQAVYPHLPRGVRRFPLPISMLKQRQASLDLLLIADFRAGADLSNVIAFLDSTTQRCGILHWPDPNTPLANALAEPILQRCAQGKLCIADQHSILDLGQLVFTATAASYWADLRPHIISLKTPAILLDGTPFQHFSLAQWHSISTPKLPSQNLPAQHFAAQHFVAQYFDAQFYLQRYPDIANSNINALAHFFQHGYQEGRLWADPLTSYQQHSAYFLAIVRQYQLDCSKDAFSRLIANLVTALKQQGESANTCLNSIRRVYPEQPAIQLLNAEEAYFTADFAQSLSISQTLLGLNNGSALPKYQHNIAKLWVQAMLACQHPSSAFHAICQYQQQLAYWPTGLIALLRHTLTEPTSLNQAQQLLQPIIATPSEQSIQALLTLAQAAKQLKNYTLAQSLLLQRIQHVTQCYPAGRPSKVAATSAGFSELARQALLDLRHCLAHANTEFFLVSGTLLGCIREGKLLSHDKDIDVGIMAPVQLPQLQQTIITHPTLALLPSPPDKLFVQHKNGVHIDIFIHWQEQGKVLHQGLTAGWWNSPFNLMPHSFLGETFLIPANVDLYLTENYGDWRTPNTEFDTFLDTTNMYVTSEAELQCYYLQAYADYHLKQKCSLKQRVQKALAKPLAAAVS